MQQNTIPLEITTLTPVHVGSGHEIKGNFEYVHFPKEGVLAVIDPEKILQIIGEDHIDLWVAAIDQQQNILNALPQLKNLQANDIAQRIITISGVSPNTEKNAIKEQIHLGNKHPSIPGSSLKGAIRTAILNKLIKDNSSFVQKEGNLTKKRKYDASQIEAFYLGREEGTNRLGEIQQSPNKDLFRFFRIRDAYFSEPTCVVRNTIINLFQHGWGEKREEGSFYECIPANAGTSSTLQIPEDLIRQVQNKRYIQSKNFDLLSAQRLFKEINKHTAFLLDEEIFFWEDEDNPLAIGDYLDHLRRLKKEVEQSSEDSCILRVGAGSGWKFTTGGWVSGKDRMGDYILSDDTWTNIKRVLRKKNYPDDVFFPKTRKMVEGGEPLGFVKLSKKN